MNLPKIEFRRITSSGTFIPEVDGLRFIAISSVVLFHIRSYFLIKGEIDSSVQSNILDFIISNGNFGVPLFFVISGFILGLPFANQNILNKTSVNLRQYFIRRLTRLEPPYFLVIFTLFIANIFIVQKYELFEGFKSLLASLTYTHNFFYGRETLPLLLEPAWSLEVEVQFYLLAPIVCLLYLIKSRDLRYSLMLFLILTFTAFDYIVTTSFISILNFLEFFLLGLLLADLKVSGFRPFGKPSNYDSLITLVSFLMLWVLSPKDKDVDDFVLELLRLISAFIFIYFVLFRSAFRFLSNKVITNIGGMCYTIYLIHFAVIRFFGRPLIEITFFEQSYLNIGIYTACFLILILLISSLFYLMVERPCMDRNWIKKLVT